MPRTGRVAVAARVNSAAQSAGSNPRSPTTITWYLRVAASSSTRFTMTLSSGNSSSSWERRRLSVDRTHKVTTWILTSSHHLTNCFSLSAPAW